MACERRHLTLEGFSASHGFMKDLTTDFCTLVGRGFGLQRAAESDFYRKKSVRSRAKWKAHEGKMVAFPDLLAWRAVNGNQRLNYERFVQAILNVKGIIRAQTRRTVPRGCAKSTTRLDFRRRVRLMCRPTSDVAQERHPALRCSMMQILSCIRELYRRVKVQLVVRRAPFPLPPTITRVKGRQSLNSLNQLLWVVRRPRLSTRPWCYTSSLVCGATPIVTAKIHLDSDGKSANGVTARESASEVDKREARFASTPHPTSSSKITSVVFYHRLLESVTPTLVKLSVRLKWKIVSSVRRTTATFEVSSCPLILARACHDYGCCFDFAKNLTGHECYHGNEIDDTGCIDPIVGGRFSIHLEWNGLQCPERRNTITGTMAPRTKTNVVTQCGRSCCRGDTKLGPCAHTVGSAMLGSNRGACSRFDNELKDNYRLYPEKYVPAIAIESSAAFTMAECIALCDSLKKGPTRNLPCNSFNFNRRESICVASFTDFKTQKKYGVGDLEGDYSVMVNGAADAQMKGWHYGLRLKTGDDDTRKIVLGHNHFTLSVNGRHASHGTGRPILKHAQCRVVGR